MALGDSSTSGDSSGGLGSLLGLGAGVGALGYLIGQGEQPLPSEFTQALGMVPGLQSNAGTLFGQGQDLTSAGRSLVQKASAGELTIPQQAELQQYKTGLQNMSNQMFASMGRDVTKDTSAINQQGNIDSLVNAMAQKEIQTTLQTGFAEISAGSQFTQESLSYSTAAADILLKAGQAQLAQDKAYSDSLTSVFSSIGKMFGSIGMGNIGAGLSSLGGGLSSMASSIGGALGGGTFADALAAGIIAV